MSILIDIFSFCLSSFGLGMFTSIVGILTSVAVSGLERCLSLSLCRQFYWDLSKILFVGRVLRLWVVSVVGKDVTWHLCLLLQAPLRSSAACASAGAGRQWWLLWKHCQAGRAHEPGGQTLGFPGPLCLSFALQFIVHCTLPHLGILPSYNRIPQL